MSIKTLAAAFAFLGVAALSVPRQHHHQTVRVVALAASSATVLIDHERLPTEPPPTTTTEPPPTTQQPKATSTKKKTSTTTTAPPEQAEPTADEAPAPPVASGSAREAIVEYFGDIYESAIGVAQCESGLDPGAISKGGGNWGLFQINTVHKSDFESYTGQSWNAGVLNAHYNAMYARKIYDGNGWGPWTCKWAA